MHRFLHARRQGRFHHPNPIVLKSHLDCFGINDCRILRVYASCTENEKQRAKILRFRIDMSKVYETTQRSTMRKSSCSGRCP